MAIISIDPSGTGTTGIYFKNGNQEKFNQYKETDWRKHYQFIASLVKKAYQPTLLLFEDTNYIHKKTKDGLSLFRLLGALETLTIPQVGKVNVVKVKELTKQLFRGTIKIEEVSYEVGRGKGWIFKGQRVSLHQLEAYLVYYLFQK